MKKKFVKLSLHDAIISSIYNTQDNANTVQKGHWPISVCNCHCLSECLMMNMLEASLQTQASQSSYLAPSVFSKWELSESTGNDW